MLYGTPAFIQHSSTIIIIDNSWPFPRGSPFPIVHTHTRAGRRLRVEEEGKKKAPKIYFLARIHVLPNVLTWFHALYPGDFTWAICVITPYSNVAGLRRRRRSDHTHTAPACPVSLCSINFNCAAVNLAAMCLCMALALPLPGGLLFTKEAEAGFLFDVVILIIPHTIQVTPYHQTQPSGPK